MSTGHSATRRVIAEMIVENTGRHLLDSCGAQGGSSRTVTVPARGWAQENDVFRALGAGERDHEVAEGAA